MLEIDAMPLFVEATETPTNPVGLPNTFPMRLTVDQDDYSIIQSTSQELIQVLDRLYDFGSTVGHAMDGAGIGLSYSEDFLKFIQTQLQHDSRVLEIGAGRGYLAHRMISAGFKVIALEPGAQQSAHWTRMGVEVIKDRFPSANVSGLFDAIVFYGVLEHIVDAGKFLDDVRAQLASGGKVILAVPDCTKEVFEGDPSMLIHEHIRYFTDRGLVRRLNLAGFSIEKMTHSGFGRSLYVSATATNSPDVPTVDPKECEAIRAYPNRVAAMRRAIERRVSKFKTNRSSLGIYCPGRALAILPISGDYRFFDDSPDLIGRYYPPFSAPIESRKQLHECPPDELWIMSRTFEKQILNILNSENYAGKVLTVSDLLELSGVS